jgi:superoxide dismutase
MIRRALTPESPPDQELHHDKHHASYVKGASVALDRLAEARHGGQYDNIAAVERALVAPFSAAPGDVRRRGHFLFGQVQWRLAVA